MRILIAEDEVSIARALKVMLERNKYAVDVVFNTKHAACEILLAACFSSSELSSYQQYVVTTIVRAQFEVYAPKGVNRIGPLQLPAQVFHPYHLRQSPISRVAFCH